MVKLSAVDSLSLLFAGGLLVMAASCGAAHVGAMAVLAAIMGGVIFAGWWGTRSAAGAFVHDFLPVLLIPVVFNTVGSVGECVNPALWDEVFAAVDDVAFSGLVVAWRGALGRPWWLTDIAYVLYVSYYVLPVVLAAELFRRRRHGAFEDLVVHVVVCFYLSYAGYLMFPTVGPRVPVEMEDTVIGGGPLSHGVRAFLYFAEHTRTDAFPSGHTAVALVCLHRAWRSLPGFRLAGAVWAAGIIFPTVYLHYHYFVDLLAGAALAAVTPACVWALQRLAEPRAARRWAAGCRSGGR